MGPDLGGGVDGRGVGVLDVEAEPKGAGALFEQRARALPPQVDAALLGDGVVVGRQQVLARDGGDEAPVEAVEQRRGVRGRGGISMMIMETGGQIAGRAAAGPRGFRCARRIGVHLKGADKIFEAAFQNLESLGQCGVRGSVDEVGVHNAV